MTGLDLDRLPKGAVLLPERDDARRQLDARAWVDAVRRPVPRQLDERVADYLAQARDHGEV